MMRKDNRFLLTFQGILCEQKKFLVTYYTGFFLSSIFFSSKFSTVYTNRRGKEDSWKKELYNLNDSLMFIWIHTKQNK